MESQAGNKPEFYRWNDPLVWQTVRPGGAWKSMGIFSFDGQSSFWRGLPSDPGIYRITFNPQTYYVGQAKSIARRLGDYFQPGQGIEVDHRIHRALRKSGGAEIEVMVGAQYESTTVRRRAEREEIEALSHIGARVLNGDCIENLEDRISYHKDEIALLQFKIDKLREGTKNSHE